MKREKAVAATYTKAEVSDYAGNPLIEALPPILSETDAAKLLQMRPSIDAKERSQKPWIRVHYLKRLRRLVLPLPSFFDYESVFSRNIRSGYAARHPFDAAVQATRYGARGTMRSYIGATLEPYSASELAVVGLSGIGKSTMVEAVLRSYPQYIVHTSYAGKRFVAHQLVWLKMNCPHNGSLSALCRSFFLAVDNATGTTNFAQKYADPRLHIDQLVQGMQQIAATYYLGVLIIDELQNLSVAKSGGAEVMMNYFMNLRTEIRTPLVLVGTYKAISLFGGEMRFARRASENGLVDLMRPTDDKDEVWRKLVDVIWSYQWVAKPKPLDDALYFKLFDLTQGVTDILVALVSVAQDYAIQSGEETVDEDVLQFCYDRGFVLLHPALAALRSKSKTRLQRFEDLLPPGGLGELQVNPKSFGPMEGTSSSGEGAQPQPAKEGKTEGPDAGASTTGADNPDDLRTPGGLEKAIEKADKIPGAPLIG